MTHELLFEKLSVYSVFSAKLITDVKREYFCSNGRQIPYIGKRSQFHLMCKIEISLLPPSSPKFFEEESQDTSVIYFRNKFTIPDINEPHNFIGFIIKPEDNKTIKYERAE